MIFFPGGRDVHFEALRANGLCAYGACQRHF
jgi:hypothetical protein